VYIRKKVCVDRNLSLDEAQDLFRRNWTEAYKVYFETASR
jgi:hypothetical protein